MLINADRNNNTDAVYHTLISKMNVDIPIVLVSWVDNFVFNDVLLNLNNYVLIDYCEYGWDWDLNKSGTHIWGVNSEKFPRYYNKEYKKFDDFIKVNPPKLNFKRELLINDVSETIKPIEYPCLVDIQPMQLREDFNNRPINVFQYWGRSNEDRLRIHAEILMHSYKKGFQTCDNLYYVQGYLNNEQCEKWVTLWIPHYHRVDISGLMQINGLSKLSLSWNGAGVKCFRTGESPVNSVMVMHKNSMAWAYGWDESNCILVEHGKEIEGIEYALKRTDLYDIYLKGVENVNKYRVNNYINYYIIPLINAVK